MDIIDGALSTAYFEKHDLHPAVRVVLGFGKGVLNSYYSRTDMSDTYRVSMDHG